MSKFPDFTTLPFDGAATTRAIVSGDSFTDNAFRFCWSCSTRRMSASSRRRPAVGTRCRSRTACTTRSRRRPTGFAPAAMLASTQSDDERRAPRVQF